MDFGEALEAMKDGKKITCPILNGGYIELIYIIHKERRQEEEPVFRLKIGNSCTNLSHILVDWVLADDWEVMESHTKPTLEDAILLAVKAHHGQKDKLGKEYILHPLWVMNHIDGDYLKKIAVLHDLVEDTDISLTDLYEMGYPSEIVEAIDALTKRPGEDLHAYLDRVMSNPLALPVKKVDTMHNTLDERMKCLPEAERKRLIEKYKNDAEYMERNIIPEVKLQRSDDTYFECPNCGGYREVIVYSEDISNNNNIKECSRCGHKVRIVNLGEFYRDLK